MTVALTLLAMITIAANKTGAAINPTVGFWQCLFYTWVQGNVSNSYKFLPIYVAGPACGGLLAGLFQRWHVVATRWSRNPEKKTHPHYLDGEAQNPSRLAGDEKTSDELIAKCEDWMAREALRMESVADLSI